MMEKITVGLVEDQLLFREGMKAILGHWANLEIVVEAGDGFSLLHKLETMSELPNVLLIDLSLPAVDNKEMDGLKLTTVLAENFPQIRLLILSAHNDDNFISQAIENGAHGYLVKEAPPNEVFEAIVSVCNKGAYINNITLAALQNKHRRKAKINPLHCSITPREREILELTCKQYTAEEIGEKLFISSKTVNGHRNNLMLKTQSRNVTGLVLYAIKNNIVQLV